MVLELIANPDADFSLNPVNELPVAAGDNLKPFVPPKSIIGLELESSGDRSMGFLIIGSCDLSAIG